MDIQAIIKQVISLAGMVIKNPSTSVKGSGIDFGSLIGMAGSMMGGKSGGNVLGGGQSSQGGGIDLGSLIGMAGSMMGGSKTTSQQTDDNPLGSILGGLAGMATGGSQQQSSKSDGGFGDILGGLAKAGLGNAMGSAMGSAMGNMFSREEASSLMSDVTEKENTISDMLKDKTLNAEQKGNLTDMLGMLKLSSAFLQK